MNTSSQNLALRGKLHPLLWVAAIAVILLSAAGLAAIFGVIPHVDSAVAPTVPTVPGGPLTQVAPSLPATAPAPAVTQAVPEVHKQANTHREPARMARAPEYYAPPPSSSQAPVVVAAAAPCRNCGVIESLRPIEQKGEGSALGVVAGGVLGGVLGHQVGGGRGKDLATVAGALGGAYAGNEVEKNVRKTVKYETIVRYEDGSSQKFMQDGAPGWHSGDHVRVDNGVIMAR